MPSSSPATTASVSLHQWANSSLSSLYRTVEEEVTLRGINDTVESNFKGIIRWKKYFEMNPVVYIAYVLRGISN